MAWRNKVARCKRIPDGWELLESTLEEFEQTMREAVDDPHDGKRKCEGQWDIHRIHWKKNRFIYEMYYKNKEISKECYDWLVRLKIADQPLISKWRKPGYEILCSMLAISQTSTNFGTVSVCRVPMRQRGGGVMPSVTTGCVSCASGDGMDGGPIWWCDKRPMGQNAHEHRADSRPNKRQKGEGEEEEKKDAPEEPKLDDAVLARLNALKGDAAATD